MQTPKEISENRAMHGIAVALLTEDQDHLSALQNRLEATRLGQAVFSHVGFPAGPTDSILRQLQDSRAEVVIVDIPAHDAQRAVHTIELIRATTQQIAIFASGEMNRPANIVASMRAGAGEYIDFGAVQKLCWKRSRAIARRAPATLAGWEKPGCSPSLGPKEVLAAPRPR